MEDLAPLFRDGCWMFVLLAKQASVGVILRRGPSGWWHVTLWDTAQDGFESGQWFHGSIYPEKCDVSPDGKLLIYSAWKSQVNDRTAVNRPPWIAVSRPPYLTALAQWRAIGADRGRGIFLDNRSVLIHGDGREHPGYPPGPLNVVEYHSLAEDDPLHNAVSGWRNGWEGTAGAQRKSSDTLILERNSKISTTHFGCRYSLHSTDGHLIAKFRAHWADFDQHGRLVATVSGHLLTGEVTENHGLQWRELAALENEQPTLLEPPAWAQSW